MKQDHFELLLEDIRDKLSVIAEGYDLLNQRIDRVETNLSEKIAGNSRQIAALSKQVAGNSQQIAANSEKLTILEKKIDDTRQELNQKIDTTRQELTQKIDRVADDVRAHRNDTERHRGYMVAEDAS